MINLFRTPASTAEQLVHSGRCLVYFIIPEVITTGTITLRNGSATGGSAVKHVAAAGLGQTGKIMGGVIFDQGLTVQLSAATDLTGIVWEPLAGSLTNTSTTYVTPG